MNPSISEGPFGNLECNAGSALTNPEDQAEFQLLDSNNTASTFPAESITATFSQTNPGAFSVPGTVIFSAQVTIRASPALLMVAPGNGSIYIGVGEFFANGPTTVPNNINPNVGFTCTVFDGTMRLSQASASNSTQGQVSCSDYYPSLPPAGSGGGDNAEALTPNAIHVGDVYTFIVSQ